MRWMLAAVVAMGVLIIAGVVVLAATILHRLATPAPTMSPVTLDEPPSTHIQAIATVGDRLAVQLSGGGPDRILLVDPRTSQVTARITLGR